MARTVRTDVIVPEILAEAVQAEFAGATALFGTGAAAVSSTLPGAARGGDALKVPYFGLLGELDDVNEGTALTPQKLTMTSETAVVQHSGKAFEITEWAQMAAAFADPYAEAARQLRVAVTRRADKALIDVAVTTGLEKNVAAAAAGTPVTILYDHVVDAKLLWGDEQSDIALLAVHSKVLGDMLKLKDSQGRPLLTDAREGELPRFLGIPTIVSDRLPIDTTITPNRYTSILAKRSALAFWFNGTPEVQTDKDILIDSRVAAVHVYWLAHRYSRVAGGTLTGAVKLITN